MKRFYGKRAWLLLASTPSALAACGATAPSNAPSIYGGLNVIKDGTTMTTSPQARLSMVLSNVPICTPHLPHGDFFVITASLLTFDGQGTPLGGLPAAGDYRATSADIIKDLPGSWAATQVDTYGDPSACGAWNCNPIARAVPGAGGFINIGSVQTSDQDAAALTANVAFRDLSFGSGAYAGPKVGSVELFAPCIFSLGLAGAAATTDPNAQR